MTYGYTVYQVVLQRLRTPTTPRPKKRTLLSRREVLTPYPIGTTVTRSHAVDDKRIDRVGQV